MSSRRYDLTIYVKIDCSHVPLVSKCFHSFDKMVRYCCDWEPEFVDEFEILFHVYDSDRGDYNINDIVEVF